MRRINSGFSLKRRSILAMAGLIAAQRGFGQRSPVSPEEFGAKGDGRADDSAAFRSAISSSDHLVLGRQRRYALRNIAIPVGTRIDGHGATLVETTLPNPFGLPILWIAGSRVTLSDIRFEGARAKHHDVGLSDSFEGGAGRTGRAFLAAIRIDAGDDDLFDVEVIACEFRDLHGACIAARHVSRLSVLRCRAADTNFELLFMANTRRVREIEVRENSLERIGTGDRRVNSNGIVVGNASAVTISGNRLASVERNALKLEQSCEDVLISANELRGNSVDNNGFVQVQSLGANASRRIVIESNVASDVGAGFSFNAARLSQVRIAHNRIEGTRGSTTGDGIQLANGDLVEIDVIDNVLTGIQRHGIVIGNERLEPRIERIRIVGNDIRLDQRSPGAAVQVTVPPGANRSDPQIFIDMNNLCGGSRGEQLRVLPNGDADAIRFVRLESPLEPCR